MDTLSRNINSLEKSVARYIYIKYIQEQVQVAGDVAVAVDVDATAAAAAAASCWP